MILRGITKTETKIEYLKILYESDIVLHSSRAKLLLFYALLCVEIGDHFFEENKYLYLFVISQLCSNEYSNI